MKRFIFSLCITLLTFLVGLGIFFGLQQIKGSPHSDQLSLKLVLETPVIKVAEPAKIKFIITNNGNETVTLVHPGDGSSAGMRTPILRWWVIENGKLTEHPMEVELIRCERIQALQWDEVFRLPPGETKEITERWLPPFGRPGTFKLRFFYENRPSLRWDGIEMGMHNPIAMWRVRNSTECKLTSNEVEFTVIP